MTDMATAPAHAGTAIVTGGARGIGAAICTRLAADGYDVAVIDLDVERCAETVAAVGALGRRAIAVGCDVSSEPAVRAGVAAVVSQLGGPRVLVNNAGLLKDATVGRMELADWDAVIDVNLKSVFLMCREVLPSMRAGGGGRVVNLSSIAALGVFGEANYSAAKAGVQGLTRTLAIELGRYGITVNAVAPGFVVTEMTRQVADRAGLTIEQLTEAMMKDIVVGRAGTPEDIAHAVSFLADPRSAFVTGQTLYVAGGPRG
ncbi:MAG: 3-oxoacyl-ACP reductase FabG [Pseudomonadota bacterium]